MINFNIFKRKKETLINKKEKLFLKLSHLDELQIYFDFLDYHNNELFYYYDTHASIYYTCLFSIEKNKKLFCIDDDLIWDNFRKKFDMSHHEITDFMKDMAKKYFNITDYDVILSYLPKIY